MTSHRIQAVQDPVIPIVGRWTAEHPGTISLGQGVVHYDPPGEVFKAVSEASLDDRRVDRYGPVAGNASLQDLIAQKLKRDNGIDVTDGHSSIVCTSGANMGFINAVLAIADIGDEIILLSPYYFNHQMAIDIAGCRTVVVATDASHQPDMDAIRSAISDKTKAIVTVSPNNPTGAVYSRDSLREINEWCSENGVYHISDEAYEYFLHDSLEPHYSPGSASDAGRHTISLFSLSKSYGMAGWRVGYGVFPEHLMESVKKIQDTNLICPPQICQVAAEGALRVGSRWCLERAAKLTAVRDAALRCLSSLGNRCDIAIPQGAFYLFLKLRSQQNDMSLVERLIREHAVAVLPGSAFGVNEGCSLRISYGALDADTVIEGVGRLERGLNAMLE